MKRLIILTIQIHICHLVLSQNFKKILPQEVGINCFTQCTQTVMQSINQTPFFNTYGFNRGIGIFLQNNVNNKWSLKIFYHYTQLINSFNPIKHDPIFSPEDKKKFNPFSFYWKSNEFGVGFKYKIFSKKGNNISFEESICTNFGQLNYGMGPSNLGVYRTEKIVYQNGKNVNLNYKIYPISVRGMGLNFISGLSYDKKISKKINLNLSIALNHGFIPLISSLIESSLSETDTIKPYWYYTEYLALSSNSGVRMGLGVSYLLKK